jgi:hypothetical protein
MNLMSIYEIMGDRIINIGHTRFGNFYKLLFLFLSNAPLPFHTELCSY